ncbi:MAG: alpha-galactosidase [Bacteroides sp.]|nr:alpha-galactosidase [Bacteroides sp.]MCM1421869.1 alpha-galactosidase [Bacteroides sp.]
MAQSVFADDFIRVNTDNVDLVLRVKDNGRVYQSYLGKHLRYEADMQNLPDGTEAYLTHGMEDYFEPAIDIQHTDKNPSLLLKYVSKDTASKDGGNETVVTLKDDKYPITVKLHYIAYPKEDIIKTYTEIENKEKGTVVLKKYASSMLHFRNANYYLTEFSGDWADEAHISTTPLNFGKKVLDTKLGTRANMFTPPMFILSLDGEATEHTGECVLGTLGWTGNFRFTFEVDNNGYLRVISGINPYASEYTLAAGQTFTTPEFYFTYSHNGTGQASRNFHDWARKYQLKNGQGDRMTLLNNWEATYFDFNEDKLCGLMGEAVKLGVDMFLLDDGWFANKYPRHSDTQGLGDWDETKDKLPNGVGRLVDEAAKKGIKFGIWIEPEMVNPKSELYEKHKDWVIHLPNRDEYYFRNQMVLDLSNPKVQDFVFGVVDNLMTKYPGIAFFKWDCNSPITNIYSPYLKDKQTHLYVDYVRGLYKVLDRIKTKYPNLPMMLCSGGSGRIDYQALNYFTEFWASDNTDPVERLFIQYGYSFFYPAKATCAHVTTWNSNASIKFRTDVAMMGKLGFDIKLNDMNEDDAKYCNEAVKNYNRLKPVVMEGDMYRLVSPYTSPHASTMFVGKDKQKAVVFAFDIYPRFGDKRHNVCLEGLDANRQYKVSEINMMPNASSSLNGNDRTYSGDYLMTVGLDMFTGNKLNSRVIEITAM